jgi:phosphatidylinositol alpha-1,6-mannosyltransferase
VSSPVSGRTLVVTNDFPPRTGGIESFVLAMVSRMDPDSVVVHTARQPGDADFDASLPFRVRRDPSPLMLPTPEITKRSIELVRDLGCDTVWFGAAAPLGLMAGKLKAAGVQRTVGTTHGHEVWWAATPGARSLLRRIGDRNDVLTYLGTYTRHRISRALSAEAGLRMVQLTPGVDEDVFHPGVDGSAVRAEHGLLGRPLVVCVARMVPRKGQDMLIQALPVLRKRVPEAALMLVGDGPYRRKLEAMVDRLGLREHVVFAGRKPWAETPAHFAAGDVFAMPCRTRKLGLEPEALGIVFLEASAVGLPVIAGDSGGAPDAVQDGVTGYVVDGRSPEAIADRLAELLLDPARSKEMGEWGRRWVEQRWTWDDVVERLQSLLRPPS